MNAVIRTAVFWESCIWIFIPVQANAEVHGVEAFVPSPISTEGELNL